jgi:hypothetical protein
MLTTNLSETVTVLELFVVLAALLGLGACVYNIGGSWSDGQTRRRSKVNGYKRRLANWSIREELFRAIRLSCFLGAGILSMTLPSSGASQNRTIAFAITFLLFGLEIVDVVGSLLAAYDRHRINEDWDKEDRLLEQHDALVRLEEQARIALGEVWDGETERREPLKVCPFCYKPLPLEGEPQAPESD